MTRRDEWREAFEAAVARDADFTTMSGVPVEPVYGPDDGEFPGQYPYTRGPHASMYRSKLWTMRMFAGFGTALDTNRRFHELLASGSDGLSTAFDLPTLMGRDSDDELALGEVGRCGVAVDTLADVEDLYRGIDLGDVTTSMTINGPAAVIFAMFVANAEATGVERARLGGTLQNDILKEYQAQKEFIFPPRPSLRLVADTMRFCTAEMPRWHPLSISGYHIREAGSTAAEELAFTVANGFAYVELGMQAGLDVDAFAPRLSFFFNAHIDFFEEIAKYRAARRIWARWLRERYGAKRERSLQMRFHTQTAGVSLTAQQPEVNIVRTAIEALAGVLGGTQSLHTNSMDETLALPTERAARHRAAHAAGDRARGARRERRRSARRLVVRRGAHRRARAPGRGDLRPHRRDGRGLDARRRRARRRGGLVPVGDRRLRLRARAQAERGPPRGGRGERVPRRQRRAAARDAAHRPRGRGGAAPPAREGARRARARARSTARSRACAPTRPSRRSTSCRRSSTRSRAYATLGEIVEALASVFGRWVEQPRI